MWPYHFQHVYFPPLGNLRHNTLSAEGQRTYPRGFFTDPNTTKEKCIVTERALCQFIAQIYLGFAFERLSDQYPLPDIYSDSPDYRRREQWSNLISTRLVQMAAAISTCLMCQSPVSTPMVRNPRALAGLLECQIRPLPSQQAASSGPAEFTLRVSSPTPREVDIQDLGFPDRVRNLVQSLLPGRYLSSSHHQRAELVNGLSRSYDRAWLDTTHMYVTHLGWGWARLDHWTRYQTSLMERMYMLPSASQPNATARVTVAQLETFQAQSYENVDTRRRKER